MNYDTKPETEEILVILDLPKGAVTSPVYYCIKLPACTGHSS